MAFDSEEHRVAWMILLRDPTEENAVAYANKWAPNTAHMKPLSLLAGAHKARCVIGSDEQFAESAAWLHKNGFQINMDTEGRRKR